MFAGESVMRRLDRLAQALGLEASARKPRASVPHDPRPLRRLKRTRCAMWCMRRIAHYIPRIGKPPGPMLDDYAQRIADEQAWVLEDAGRIVGILVLEQTADRASCWTTSRYRRTDRARVSAARCMEFAEAEARRRGFQEIQLYTHALMTENIGIYTRAGYVETHRVSEKGYDRVYMTKRLEG